MNSFNIFTVCTENYKDAIKFSVPSWLSHPSVSNVYIYTDFDFKYPDPRVIIKNVIEKTEDWLDIMGMKVSIARNLLEESAEKRFAYIDLDCYMLKDISDVFNNDFDVAATRIIGSNMDVNGGVWFFQNTDAAKQFFDEWIVKQAGYRKRGIGCKVYQSAYDQKALTEITRREYHNPTYLKVFAADASIYNSEHNNRLKWIDKVKQTNPKMLHFKGKRWKNKELIETLIGIDKLVNNHNIKL